MGERKFSIQFPEYEDFQIVELFGLRIISKKSIYLSVSYFQLVSNSYCLLEDFISCIEFCFICSKIRVRATLESSSKRGSFDKISSRQEFWNFENWKWEIDNIFCIVCELKESENHLSTSFKKLWVVGGGALRL